MLIPKALLLVDILYTGYKKKNKVNTIVKPVTTIASSLRSESNNYFSYFVVIYNISSIDQV